MIHRAFPKPNSQGEWLTYCGQTRIWWGNSTMSWKIWESIATSVSTDPAVQGSELGDCPSDYVLQS